MFIHNDNGYYILLHRNEKGTIFDKYPIKNIAELILHRDNNLFIMTHKQSTFGFNLEFFMPGFGNVTDNLDTTTPTILKDYIEKLYQHATGTPLIPIT